MDHLLWKEKEIQMVESRAYKVNLRTMQNNCLWNYCQNQALIQE
jgi:hypothetical protein